MNRAIFLYISITLAGCGGSVVPGSEQGTGGTAGAQGECEPLPCPYPGWDPVACKCREAPDAGQEAAVDAAHSNLVISIVESSLGADCMPQVPPDPVNGTFTVRYDNSQGAAVSIALTSAELQLADAWSFEATPADIGVIGAGAVAEIEHSKVPGSGKGQSKPCSACGDVVQLRVTWKLSDGQTVTESKSSQLQCAL